VLGAAWVRHGSVDADTAEILDVRAIGVTVSGSAYMRMAAGLVSYSEIAVPDSAKDTRIEVSRMPWRALRIHTNEMCPWPSRSNGLSNIGEQ
jgi:hypothetical protein